MVFQGLPLFPYRAQLTPRQLEVVTYMVHEFTNKEMARELKISHRTVEDYREMVFE